MKKLILLIATIGFFVASCKKEDKKDYLCTCTTTQSNGVLVGTRDATINGTKEHANAACVAGNSNTPVSNGYSTTTDCKIQ